MSSIRAVLFDLYGTLLVYGDMKRAWADWFHWVEAALHTAGSTLNRAEIQAHCDGMFARPVIARPGLTVYETRLQDLARQCGIDMSAPMCAKLATTSLAVWQAYVTADPSAGAVLARLRASGMQLGLLTNFDHPPHVRGLLQRTGWDAYFVAVTISGETGLKKPDPQIFTRALDALGVSADQCVFVGDHPEEDVQGALTSGLRGVLLQRGQGLDRLHTDYRSDPHPGEIASAASNYPVVYSLYNLCAFLEIP